MIPNEFDEVLELIEQARRATERASMRLYSSRMDRASMTMDQVARVVHQSGDLQNAMTNLITEVQDQQIVAIARALS
jgi:phage host-nuclease inhibitor protein Gam